MHADKDVRLLEVRDHSPLGEVDEAVVLPREHDTIAGAFEEFLQAQRGIESESLLVQAQPGVGLSVVAAAVSRIDCNDPRHRPPRHSDAWTQQRGETALVIDAVDIKLSARFDRRRSL